MYLLAPISPVLCSRWRFRRTFGRPLDLRTPRTLNEKLMWLKLRRYGSDPLVTRCADKYAAHHAAADNDYVVGLLYRLSSFLFRGTGSVWGR